MSTTTTTPPLPELTEQLMMTAARQLAMGLVDAENIQKSLQVSPNSWARMLAHPYFQEYVRTFRATWESGENTPNRVRAKAALMLEECMPELYVIIADRKVEPRVRMQAIETIKKISDDPKNSEPMHAGQQLTINIDLGGQGIHTSTMAPMANLIDGETTDANS